MNKLTENLIILKINQNKHILVGNWFNTIMLILLHSTIFIVR